MKRLFFTIALLGFCSLPCIAAPADDAAIAAIQEEAAQKSIAANREMSREEIEILPDVAKTDEWVSTLFDQLAIVSTSRPASQATKFREDAQLRMMGMLIRQNARIIALLEAQKKPTEPTKK